MYKELETAKQNAVRAGAILLQHCTRSSPREEERGHLMTEARQSASAFLAKELKQSFPGDGILSQEDQHHSDSKSRVWMIEPLDGAQEFKDGRNEFAVMIGLSVDGAANLGVIYQPRTEKMYYAISGGGAFLVENRSTRLLRVPPEPDPLAMTIVLSRCPQAADPGLLQQQLGVGSSMLHGGLGLNVGLICEGVAHVYVHPRHHTYPWATCAAEAILHEAGGRMTNRFNAPLRYDAIARNPGPVIASSGSIHERIVDVTQSLLPQRRDLPETAVAHS
jgi:3'(2'), 5'-bisphosphate nucleotidase